MQSQEIPKQRVKLTFSFEVEGKLLLTKEVEFNTNSSAAEFYRATEICRKIELAKVENEFNDIREQHGELLYREANGSTKVVRTSQRE